MTLPLGFRFAATYAGIRKTVKEDLVLIVSDPPAAGAAVFTQNRVQAAPVIVSKKHLKASRGTVRAIVINAGNANCATRTGEKIALSTCRAAARLLKAPVAQVLPASTGVIGVEMDGGKIERAMPGLAASLSEGNFGAAAAAIMTTDIVPKTAMAEIAVGDGTVRIAGMTKGSGMIQPMMATTLGFLMTDAMIPAPTLRKMLLRANELSYSRISVDGDTSTNDTLILMANGASGIRLRGSDSDLFELALTKVAQDLARQIARDGEGASKLITITVIGTADDNDAARIARSIANSPLLKTAVYGNDPNWGRILSAAGNSGVAFDPHKVDVWMQGVQVCAAGFAAKFSEDELKQKLAAKDCLIDLRFRGNGQGQARFWTCDYTEGYISINASYRT